MKKFLPYIVVGIIVVIVVVLSLEQNNDGEEMGIVPDMLVDHFVSGSDLVGEGVKSSITIGSKAPNFRLETFEGKIVELDSLDKPIVIDFWAGWCPFCIDEMPDLEAVHQEFGDKVIFLGIHRSNTESVEKGEGFVTELGITYSLLKDTTGGVYKVYSGGQPFMPVAYFLDSDGIIVGRVLGPKTGDKIKSLVEKVLN